MDVEITLVQDCRLVLFKQINFWCKADSVSGRHQITCSATKGLCLSARTGTSISFLRASFALHIGWNILNQGNIFLTFFLNSFLWTSKTQSLGLPGCEEWGKPIKTLPHLYSNLLLCGATGNRLHGLVSPETSKTSHEKMPFQHISLSPHNWSEVFKSLTGLRAPNRSLSLKCQHVFSANNYLSSNATRSKKTRWVGKTLGEEAKPMDNSFSLQGSCPHGAIQCWLKTCTCTAFNLVKH